MKPTQEDSNYPEETKKLVEFFSPKELCVLGLSELGYSSIFFKFIVSKFHIKELSSDILYAMLQHANDVVIVGKVLNGELSSEEGKNDLKIDYMPSGDGAWESEADFEMRLIFLVRALHDDLKKRGKIP